MVSGGVIGLVSTLRGCDEQTPILVSTLLLVVHRVVIEAWQSALCVRVLKGVRGGRRCGRVREEVLHALQTKQVGDHFFLKKL